MNNLNTDGEILIVVDQDDNVLDYLPRKTVHERQLLHRTISIVTFTSSGKIVLQKRSKNKDTYPGMLGNAIGGHVIKGEEYLDTAKNEAQEELKIHIDPQLIIKTVLNDPKHPTMTTIYKIVYDGPYDYNKEEIDEIIVLNKEEIKSRLNELFPSTKMTLKEAGVL